MYKNYNVVHLVVSVYHVCHLVHTWAQEA